MKWLRKLFAEIVEMCFMMVGITPPKSAHKEKEADSKRE